MILFCSNAAFHTICEESEKYLEVLKTGTCNFHRCRINKFAVNALLFNTQYFIVADSDMQLTHAEFIPYISRQQWLQETATILCYILYYVVLYENIIGDFKAKVGRENIFKRTIGQESLHQDSNDNGVRLVNFATSKNLVVKSSMFHHRNIHQ